MLGLLKQADKDAGQLIPRRPPPPTRRGREAVRRVLIADACPDTVESAAWLLRLWGHDVRGVRTGREVLDAARAYRPDVILMELALPEVDGCEVARRLRKQGGPDVLLVAVTGYGDEKNRRRSREAGFDWHLIKPVEPEFLQRLLAANHQEIGGR
jgi:CheY-like chemotaxis protein